MEPAQKSRILRLALDIIPAPQAENDMETWGQRL